jgi:uncharacterized caspase-like protein
MRHDRSMFILALTGGLIAAGAVAVTVAQETPVPAAKSLGNCYALLIGVGKYDSIRPLNFTCADAISLQQSLVTGGFSPERITLMHDTVTDPSCRPTKANIERQLLRLLKLVQPVDSVLIMFSGHGIAISGKSYLCPLDTRLDRLDSLISIETICQQLDRSPANVRLCLFNACRIEAGQARRRPSVKRSALEQFYRSQDQIPGGVILLSSCDAGEVSVEVKQLGHALFIHHVLEGIAGQADLNHDRSVTLEELFKYAAARTKSDAEQKYDYNQVPKLRGDLTADALEFVLATVGVESLMDPFAATPIKEASGGDTDNRR